jgi:nicotinamidase-related amidase
MRPISAGERRTPGGSNTIELVLDAESYTMQYCMQSKPSAEAAMTSKTKREAELDRPPRGMDGNARCALVTSECQTAILDPATAMFKGLAEAAQARELPKRIASLAAACRRAELPVIHCTVRLLPDARAFQTASALQAVMRRNPLLQRHRPEASLHPALEAQGTDIISDRMHGITAFHGTELESLLRGLNISTIILTGVSTNIALIGTSIEAVNRGFSVIIPEDCTAGATPETHDHAVRHTLPNIATISNSQQVIDHLPRPQRPPGGCAPAP